MQTMPLTSRCAGPQQRPHHRSWPRGASSKDGLWWQHPACEPPACPHTNSPHTSRPHTSSPGYTPTSTSWHRPSRPRCRRNKRWAQQCSSRCRGSCLRARPGLRGGGSCAACVCACAHPRELLVYMDVVSFMATSLLPVASPCPAQHVRQGMAA